jgi:hypothetical protein
LSRIEAGKAGANNKGSRERSRTLGSSLDGGPAAGAVLRRRLEPPFNDKFGSVETKANEVLTCVTFLETLCCLRLLYQLRSWTVFESWVVPGRGYAGDTGKLKQKGLHDRNLASGQKGAADAPSIPKFLVDEVAL